MRKQEKIIEIDLPKEFVQEYAEKIIRDNKELFDKLADL